MGARLADGLGDPGQFLEQFRLRHDPVSGRAGEYSQRNYRISANRRSQRPPDVAVYQTAADSLCDTALAAAEYPGLREHVRPGVRANTRRTRRANDDYGH